MSKVMASADSAIATLCFRSLMTFINCCNVIEMAEWVATFGQITELHPWGEHFWVGFRTLMMNVYRHRMTKNRHLTTLSPELVHFELPEMFSKARAKQAKDDECNRGSGHFYPGWAWRAEGTCLAYVVCINMCIHNSSPWLIHLSWVNFLEAGSSASSSSSSPSSELPLSYLLIHSTVVIEELSDDTTV